MKKFKLGFSLGEVLLALGIISIVATMGYTATKKNVENAYDLYYYTAYKGLYEIIEDAKKNGIAIHHNEHWQPGTMKNFLDFMAERIVGGNHIEGSRIVTASNGISYNFIDSNSGDIEDFFIHVRVPAKRTADNSEGNMCLYLRQHDNGNFALIPTEDSFDYLGCPTSKDFQKRTDILPFYLDDGITGRNSLANNNITYSNFNETFCNVHNSYAQITNVGGRFAQYELNIRENTQSGGYSPSHRVINCDGNTGENNRLLRLGKPRRLR